MVLSTKALILCVYIVTLAIAVMMAANRNEAEAPNYPVGWDDESEESKNWRYSFA